MTTERLPQDITVIGLGIDGVHQLTRQAEETLRRSRVTFVTDLAPGVIEYLRDLSPRIMDLSAYRADGDHRVPIYRRMAGDVVAAALDDPPVCFATYGHPLVYCYPTTLIRRAARVLDLKVAVLPGISSIDTLLADAGVDPAFDGLQVYEATDLVIRARPLQDDVGTVILQAPIVLDPDNRAGRNRAENLRVLEDHLLRYYPKDHRALLMISSIHPLLEPIRFEVPIGELVSVLERASTVATLYIPPVRHREVADQKLADRMRERDTEPPRRPVPHRPGRPPIGPRPDPR